MTVARVELGRFHGLDLGTAPSARKAPARNVRCTSARDARYWARVSTATHGVVVRVEPSYLPRQSNPRERRFVFAYRVWISNEGPTKVQLRRRHWVITDAVGVVREVRGEGVVGAQPLIEPGASYEYTSGCVLETPWGTMHGSYELERPGGSTFEATIAPFLLAHPSVDSSAN
ncbi:MAG: Co2+/Mg2+ efflux protein ApaG [Deltaproteobacteria bacterium]|nr:Co2+/Mg2+ efflux protein ApaG [Deltaproteobacteria bacterium]